ncbi:glucans biosynthesis glucosyltransferase MdoH [Ancylobacter polymorphus]|uniref:Glucans biosynthesis glucosyltransferase H n=2 Tax=Ancylobacter polymorphus TaxID=223390 RepID=A0A9E6ZT94_9HYPH|nr:glucans biosynthesis glucosyltransferase MdoH [Ancylobacter polymorphus]UOK71306.1 glucans biosynthesis glucosyltransferase MdoH [Ancylobacter polymorphus]
MSRPAPRAMEGAAGADHSPALPPESPLAMPVQPLGRVPGASAPGPRPASLLFRRAFVISGTAALTVLAANEMYRVLDVGGVTLLEYLVLCLFVLLFAWIGFAFTNAVLGLYGLLRGPDGTLGIATAGPRPALSARHALLLPVYNEDPGRVLAGLEATCESLDATGAGAQFDVFILSDTTDPDVWVAEEAGFLPLRARWGRAGGLFYRRRPRNTGRKAGNIAEWVTRFGGAYESFLILDADSVMTGDCIVRLAAAMEANPTAGLIQTLPVIVGGRTLFARLQQFAGRLYGPLIAQGLASWSGPESNYWGHNAMIRTRAFAEGAGLPELKGPKPFGGHILSHDFIEAALMRRRGWGMQMVPWLQGSYEEGPPTLTDLAVRDRRWCQGNLQHIAVLPARGLHPVSRLHLLTGIGSYLTAPLWLVMLLAGLATALQARFVPPDYFPSGFSLFPAWPAQDPVRAVQVFIGTMAVLLLPKLFAYGALLASRFHRRAFGGGTLTLAGLLAETLISGLLAPVTMFTQSMAVVGILAGRDGGWQPQRRDDDHIDTASVVRFFLPHTLAGWLLGAAALSISLPLFLWMAPVVLGLALAIPLVLWTGSTRASLAALFCTPEEREPPPVLRRARELRQAARLAAPTEAVARLATAPELLAFHRAQLTDGERRRGDYTPERLIAVAKIADAESLEAALAALTPREKAAGLGDFHALDALLALTRDPAGHL